MKTARKHKRLREKKQYILKITPIVMNMLKIVKIEVLNGQLSSTKKLIRLVQQTSKMLMKLHNPEILPALRTRKERQKISMEPMVSPT